MVKDGNDFIGNMERCIFVVCVNNHKPDLTGLKI
jgi:hypothetical protein